MTTKRVTQLLLLAASVGIGAGLNAAPREAGSNDALRKAQYMLQKLSADKAALEQDNLRLAEELKQAQDELDTTRKTLEKTEQARGSERQKNAALALRVQADGSRISELQSAQRKAMDDARADIQLLQNAVQERDRWITDCQAKNDSLYQTNAELLAAYRDKGAFAALAQSEPLTGIASVKVENVVQEYRFRLEDLRTVKFAPSAAAGQQQP